MKWDLRFLSFSDTHKEISNSLVNEDNLAVKQNGIINSKVLPLGWIWYGGLAPNVLADWPLRQCVIGNMISNIIQIWITNELQNIMKTGRNSRRRVRCRTNKPTVMALSYLSRGSPKKLTEQLTLVTCIGRRFSEIVTILSEGRHGSPQLLHSNPGIPP
jgi:hypothetical protein